MIRRIHLESDAGTLSSCLFPKGAAQNRFILVIDDSPTIRKIIEVCLSRKGFEVESYTDGIEALRTFTDDPQKRIPHLVIVDIDLPKMNGYEIARFLRAKPQWKQTGIVMLCSLDILVFSNSSRHLWQEHRPISRNRLRPK